jgi:metal-responsive CopG/Arc/MetJ family transcriptional regulator
MSSKPVTITLPEKLNKNLEAFCKANGFTKSGFIQLMIRQGISKND